MNAPLLFAILLGTTLASLGSHCERPDSPFGPRRTSSDASVAAIATAEHRNIPIPLPSQHGGPSSMPVQETRLPFLDQAKATRLQALPGTCQFSQRSQTVAASPVTATALVPKTDDLQDRLHQKLVAILDPEK